MGLRNSTPAKRDASNVSRSSVIIKKKTPHSKTSSTVDMLQAALRAEEVRPLSDIPAAFSTVQVKWEDGCWFDAEVRRYDKIDDKVLVMYVDGIYEWVHADECRAVKSNDDECSISETVENEVEKSVSSNVVHGNSDGV